MRNKLKTVSLFTGAGGLDLGADLAGAEVIFATDIDPVICETLKVNFPKATVVADDIKNIKTFPKADLLIGGYPCQSFSLGGKRNPEKDSRTYLYLEYARALKIIQPKYFVVENVSGLSGLKGGTFLEKQLETLSNVGKEYEVTYKIVDAKDYGVPHTRKRIFLVGIRKDLGLKYIFPQATHGKGQGLIPYTSHGEVIADLPLWPKGEFYERPDEH